jgi:4-amino-4-deoxy-L-arabinose transferase-like glycosyltransferase
LAGDDTLYHDFAMRLLQGKSIYPFVPPAVGYYVALFYRLFGVSPMVARASMLPLAVAFMYILYSVAERFADRKSANLLCLVFAIYPVHVLFSVEPLTELPASLLLLITVSLMFAIRAESRVWVFVLLGFALGLLILLRPSAILMLVLLPVYLGVRFRKWMASTLVAAVPALMITVWILMIYDSTGHFVMINFSSTQNVFLGNSPYTPLYRPWWLTSHSDDETELPDGYRALNAEITRLPWYKQNDLYRRVAFESIASRPDLFAIRTLNRMRVYFAFDSYTGSLLLNRYYTGRKLAFAAIILDGSLYILLTSCAVIFLLTVSRNSVRFWPTLTIVGMILIYAGPYFFSVSHPVYHFPVVPLMGLLAAALWSDVLDGRTILTNVIFGRGAKQIVTAFAMVLFVYIQVEYAVVMFLYSSR